MQDEHENRVTSRLPCNSPVQGSRVLSGARNAEPASRTPCARLRSSASALRMLGLRTVPLIRLPCHPLHLYRQGFILPNYPSHTLYGFRRDRTPCLCSALNRFYYLPVILSVMIRFFGARKFSNKGCGRRINGAGDGGLGGKNPPEWPGHYFRPSIRSAEAEDGSSGHGVADYGFWNPTPGRPRELAGLPLPHTIRKG